MAKNNKVIKKQTKRYQHLLERYEEMNDYLLDLIAEHQRTREELRYMNDFIHYKNLEEEFSYLENMRMRIRIQNYRFHISYCKK